MQSNGVLKKCLKTFLLNVVFIHALTAQVVEKPFIKLTDPLKEINIVNASRQFIVGSTCKGCTMMINEQKLKVYATGAFAYEIKLPPRRN